MRNKIVQIPHTELEQIAKNVKSVLSLLYPKRKLIFSKYKNSPTYALLQSAIQSKTNETISTSTLCAIVTTEHTGKIKEGTLSILEKFVSESKDFKQIPASQDVLWASDYTKKAGIYLNGLHGEYIDWVDMEKEIEVQILSDCPRIIPFGSYAKPMKFYNKANHIVKIFDPSGNVVGDLWFGRDPDNNWKQDGLVRIGKAITDSKWEVYQIYQRFSDGSYRLLKSYV